MRPCDVQNALFLVLLVAVIAAFDVSRWWFQGVDHTITWSFWLANARWPWIGLMAGFIGGALYGHLFL